MAGIALLALCLLLAAAAAPVRGGRSADFIVMPGEKSEPWGEQLPIEQEDQEAEMKGTRWAVLIAGSMGYGNYRHQVSE